MSLVIVIVGLVSTIVFPALQAARKSAQQSATTANLAALMRASAAFLHANGCLPCPTPAKTINGGAGRVRGEASGPPCGDCSVREGIAPFASLGVPSAMAKDGWGRWITMRVDPALTVSFGKPPLAPTTGLCQENLSKQANAVPVKVSTPGASSQTAAILFASHGPNGSGAFRSGMPNNQHPPYNGPSTPCSATGGFERCNVDDDSSFTDAPMSGDFDDFLLYLDRNALVAHLGNAVCQTEW